MPDATLQPAVPGRTTPDETTPAVHMTRRARIEAERRAAAAAASEQAVQPANQVSPMTPPAPSSPVLPASTFQTQTPPAPSSPVIAPQQSVTRPSSPGAARATSASSSARTMSAPSTAGATSAPSTVRATSAQSTARPASAPRVDRATRHLGAGRPSVAAPAATSGRSGSAFRRNASRATAVGALLFVAGLVVSTSLPAQALYAPQPGATTVQAAVNGDTQSLRVGDATEVPTNRDAYTVSDATQYKNVDSSSFTNDPNGTIQWPFLTGVPITSGFGGRQVEGCSFCSTNHQGVDFAPGEGTPIRVIAAGTVIKVQADDGGFGNDVWVEHDVDGKQFTSVYGHMEDNSFKVVKGQQVAVGDELGLVGSTGNSTGPHLHLEVHVDGVPVDPLAWLKANAN